MRWVFFLCLHSKHVFQLCDQLRCTLERGVVYSPCHVVGSFCGHDYEVCVLAVAASFWLEYVCGEAGLWKHFKQESFKDVAPNATHVAPTLWQTDLALGHSAL